MTLNDFLGFSWHMIKAMAKPFGFVMYFVCLIGMNFGPKELQLWFFAGFILCFLSWMWPLTRDLFKYEYEKYRAKKEEAWNILKDTK
jgi:hypothetical protein